MCRIVPYYDRTELIQETTQDRRAESASAACCSSSSLLGMFLFSVRTALIVAVTIPFSLLFSFICLDWAHIPANLLSIGAIDFGMIVDGAVVMVENIFRELAERHGQKYDTVDVIRARRERCRTADLLCDRGDRRRVSADLRLDRAVGPLFPGRWPGQHVDRQIPGDDHQRSHRRSGAPRLSRLPE